MFNISSAMGPQFANAAQEMTQAITRLGPNLLKNGTAALRKNEVEQPGGESHDHSRTETS